MSFIPRLQEISPARSGVPHPARLSDPKDELLYRRAIQAGNKVFGGISAPAYKALKQETTLRLKAISESEELSASEKVERSKSCLLQAQERGYIASAQMRLGSAASHSAVEALLLLGERDDMGAALKDAASAVFGYGNCRNLESDSRAHMELLLSFGADPNEVVGDTALHRACRNDAPASVIETLRRWGADWDVQDTLGISARQCAKMFLARGALAILEREALESALPPGQDRADQADQLDRISDDTAMDEPRPSTQGDSLMTVKKTRL